MLHRMLTPLPVLCGLLLAGCGGPPPPPPTVVEAKVSAAADANGAAPVSLRIYQLVSPAGFEAAQFFPLFNGDAAVLKDDLVKRDDLLLAPGQSRSLTLSPPDRAKAIGVFGAYRDYEKVSWRGVAAIPPNATSVLSVTAGASGLSVKIEPAKP